MRVDVMATLGGKLVATIPSPFSNEQKHNFDGYEHHSRNYQERECSRDEPPRAFTSHSRKLTASLMSAMGGKQTLARLLLVSETP